VGQHIARVGNSAMSPEQFVDFLKQLHAIDITLTWIAVVLTAMLFFK
jgi:hypothetical protein